MGINIVAIQNIGEEESKGLKPFTPRIAAREKYPLQHTIKLEVSLWEAS